jgi:hypothetical protein
LARESLVSDQASRLQPSPARILLGAAVERKVFLVRHESS